MSLSAGRFAPSPTGPLHSGSLLAAAASHLDARSRGHRWLLRIDDLDTYRNVDGAETCILTALEAHGLEWDGPVLRQSNRIEEYQSALSQLAARGEIFYCTCSRNDLKGRGAYPGTCRSHTRPRVDAAIRVNVSDRPQSFVDLIAGPQTENLSQTCGDFIIRRRDGLVAYQLATAVDDGDSAIRYVVRGGDLLDNTPRQIYLMQLLNLSTPTYAHLPTLTDLTGMKLSKQSHAPALENSRASANLLEVFGYLGLRPPSEAEHWSPARIVAWGIDHWSLDSIAAGNVIFRH